MMKRKMKIKERKPFCNSNACRQCSFCMDSKGNRKKVVKAEIKALYDAEVLAYSFYFYQQLVTGGK